MKKLFGLIFFAILLISLTSATTWTKSVDYNKEDIREVAFKDWWNIPLITGTQGTMKLASHELNEEKEIVTLQTGLGWQVTMYYDFDFRELIENGLGDVEIINMKTGKSVDRDWKYVYWFEEERIRDVCVEWEVAIDSGKNDSNVSIENGNPKCLKQGTETYTFSEWRDYNSRDIPKSLRIGIMVNNRQGDYLDGIWNIGSKRLDRHAYWNASLETNLVNWYKMDDNLATTNFIDSHGTRNATGSSNSNVLTTDSGYINRAGNFTTTNSYIETAEIIPMGQTFSYALWFNMQSDTSASDQVLIGYMLNSGHLNWKAISIRSTGLASFYLRIGATLAEIKSTSSFSNSGWHHIVTTFNGTHGIIYVNGTQEAITAITLNTFNDTKISIGRASGENSYYVSKSLIDEVGIWSRALSSTEVTNLYNEGRGCTYGLCDVVPPINVTLLNPANDLKLNYQNIDFSANVTPTILTITNVSLLIDDLIVSTNSSGASGAYNFTETIAEGNHNWSVIAYGSDDVRYNATETRTFIVDVTDPTIVAGLNNTILYKEGEVLLLNTTVTDTNLDKVWYSYNGSNNTIAGAITGTLNQTAITTTLTKLEIIVYANDTAGNDATPVTLTLTVDATAPTIVINSGNGTFDYANLNVNHTINFTATDTNLDKCWYYYNSSELNSFETGNDGWTLNTGSSRSTAWASQGIYSVYFDRSVGGVNIIQKVVDVTDIEYVSFDFKVTEGTAQFYVSGLTTDYYLSNTIGEYNYIIPVTSTGNQTIIFKVANIVGQTYGKGYIDNINFYSNGEVASCSTGVLSSINFTLEKDVYSATIFANDTAGNVNSSLVEWDYQMLYLNESYTTPILEGISNTFTINIATNGTAITIGRLNYDGLNYTASISSVGNTYTITRSIVSPQVSTATNKTFFWYLTSPIQTSTSDSNIQTVNPIVITTNCTSRYSLYNLTFVDEVTQATFANATANETFLKAEINLYTSDRSILLQAFSTEVLKTNPVAICIDNNMSSGESYSVDALFQYGATNYSSELYHIENFIFNSSTLNQTMNLYDLDTTNTQKFKLIARDSAFSPIEGALIKIERKYIENGTFYITEIPKTDGNGETSASLQVNDVIYNFYIIKDGVTLNTFSNVVAICQTPLVSTCEIEFNTYLAGVTIPDWETEDDFNFTLGYNSTTRVISSLFVIPSGEPSTIRLTVTKQDALGTSVCSDTLTSTTGTLSCIVPSAFGNSTIMATLYKDDVQMGFGQVKLDQKASDIFGVVLIILSVLVFMTMMGIGLSDNPVVTILLVFVAFALLIGLNVVDGTWIGKGATILFLAIAIVIFIIKAGRRN
jgi:hypothetical protein